MSGSEQLKMLLTYLKSTINKVAIETGINKQVLYDIKNGKIKSLSNNLILSITKTYPQVNSDWLLTGNGDMLKTSQSQDDLPVAIPNKKGIPLIPVDAIAGVLSGEDVQILEYECEQFVVPTFKDAEFLMQVKGSSMIPKYNSGDIVACKRIREMLFFQWNKIYVLDTSQGVLIKRVHEDPNNDENVLLVSDNEKYKPFSIPRSDIRSIAIVIGVIRLE